MATYDARDPERVFDESLESQLPGRPKTLASQLGRAARGTVEDVSGAVSTVADAAVGTPKQYWGNVFSDVANEFNQGFSGAPPTGQQLTPAQVNTQAIPPAALEPTQQSTGAFVPISAQQNAPMGDSQGAASAPAFFQPNLGGIDRLSGQVAANQANLMGELQTAQKEESAQFKEQEKAIVEASKQAQIKAAAESAYKQAEARAKADQAAKELAAQEALNKKQAEIQSQIDETTQNYKNAKVDPTRYWANMSTPSKILAGVAMAMGAIGGALTGRGTNAAVDIIQKAIDDDVKQQQDQIERARQAGVDLRTQLGDYERITGNKQAAAKLVTAQRLEQAASQMEAEIAKTKDPELKAQQSLQLAQLRAEAAKARRESAGVISEAMRQGTGQQIQLEGMRQSAIQSSEQANAQVGAAAMKQGEKQAYLKGVEFEPGREPTREQIDKDIRPAIEEMNNIKRQAEKIKALRSKTGSTIGATRGELNQQGKIFINMVKRYIVKAGAAESEQEAADKYAIAGFEDATDWGNVESRMMNAVGVVEDAARAKLDTYGGKLAGEKPQFGTVR